MPSAPFSNSRYPDINLAIVCPMANEKSRAEKFVREVLERCSVFGFRSIQFYAVLDKVSQDGTLDILRSLAEELSMLCVVFAPENKNVVDAYKKGYSAALEGGADWILEIDAGYSHLPSDIPKFFYAMTEGEYDCIFGSRFCKNGEMINAPWQRYALSRGGTILTNFMLGTRLQDMTSGFELFTREALEQILNKSIRSTSPFFQTEIKTFAHQFKITEVPITYNSPNHKISVLAIKDSLANLFRLFQIRIRNNFNN